MVEPIVQKAVEILLKIKHHEEATKAIGKFHEVARKGYESLKQDTREAEAKVTGFLKKWKYELVLLGGALGGLWALAKYSPIAAVMIPKAAT